MLDGRRILLIVAGGIAAYKALELIRLLRREGAAVRCVLTEGGAHFVTPLSLQALSEDRVYTDLFSLTDESEMGHIQLSRAADLVVVAPASADILARMAAGFANDLATTLLLATDKPVLVAPAMNVRMWGHPATVANMATLKARGVAVVEPEEGAMACGEWGPGRLAEPPAILASIMAMLGAAPQPPSGNTLTGRHILVTSGPTHEPIDPVRYIANRSSGRQGHAIAAALAALGARVTLVSGPVTIPPPAGVKTVPVETAEQMLAACRAALPAEAAVCVAAVADWRVGSPRTHKIKKVAGREAPSLELIANPDILATLSAPGEARPRLVVGFAAETDDVMANATEKRRRKGCDWLVANDVSEAGGAMGGLENEVHLITAEGVEDWPRMAKEAVAARLAARIAEALA
jgi:phosphopantothenoylcysteine decarboxylase/phosphopantothenate--cysteine ligase